MSITSSLFHFCSRRETVTFPSKTTLRRCRQRHTGGRQPSPLPPPLCHATATTRDNPPGAKTSAQTKEQHPLMITLERQPRWLSIPLRNRHHHSFLITCMVQIIEPPKIICTMQLQGGGENGMPLQFLRSHNTFKRYKRKILNFIKIKSLGLQRTQFPMA